MDIKNEQKLREVMDSYEKVIIYGAKALVIITLRLLQKEERTQQIEGVSYLRSRSPHKTFLDLPNRAILKYEPNENTAVLVALREEEERKAAVEILSTNWKQEQIFMLDYEFLAELSRKDHRKVDFLCVGFTKCGTTSLYQALRKNCSIVMPKEKETLYGSWKNRYIDGPERFYEQYCQDIPDDKTFVGVEPTYFQRASFVYESFGKDVKLVFVLRNPADATYSYFKMMMRRSVDPRPMEYYKKYRKYSPEMFQDYMQDHVFSDNDHRFQYDVWIQDYLKYYPKEQMMFVFFEELLKEPERLLKEIQKFIGVKPKKLKKLPYSNQGKEVSRNYLCARINSKLLRMALNRKQDASLEKRKRFKKFRRMVYKFTMKENNEKITAADKQKLMDFYADSIRQVEMLTGKSLKGLWY